MGFDYIGAMNREFSSDDELLRYVKILVEKNMTVGNKRMQIAVDGINKAIAFDKDLDKLHVDAEGTTGVFKGSMEKCQQKLDGREYISPIVQIGDFKQAYVGSDDTSFDYVMNNATFHNEKNPAKKIRIRLAFRDKDPFFLIFEYQGDKNNSLQAALKIAFPNSKVSQEEGCIIINELVDNYRDYCDKFVTLMQHNAMLPFVDDIKMWPCKRPDGVDFSVMFQPFDPAVWHMFKGKIVFNITDNRVMTYNNCIINSGGGNMTVQQVSDASGVDEEKIDVEYLKWVSENSPERGEHKSVYYKRMKKANPKFVGGPHVHNKYMDALGWADNRAHTGHRVWIKK